MKDWPFLRVGAFVAVIAAALDQATKWWILLDLMDPPRYIEITPFFNLVLVFNRGVSFGLLSNDSPWGQPLLIALAAAISIFLVIWLRKAENRIVAVGIGMVLGGAVGNVVDRVVHAGVVDFLDFHVSGYHWPAFNVADSAITVGVVFLLYDGLIAARSETK